jgi:hypothetical protein
VGPNGEITGIVPPTVNNIITINAAYPPQRPFPASYGTGQGATFDVASGSYAGCSFIPGYAPGGVPVPVDGQGHPRVGFNAFGSSTFFPRNCFFSWYGATPGGADPVSDYFTNLGVPIQNGPPNGYGNALPIYEYVMDNTGNITSNTVRDYAQGFDPTFQALARTWRWITIDDARALYGRINLPFVLNATIVPASWEVQNITGSVTPDVSTTAHNDGGNFVLSDHAADGTPQTYPGNSSLITYPTCQPPANAGGGGLGDVNEIVCGWYANSDGNWATGYGGQPLCSPSSPAAPAYHLFFDWTDTSGPNSCSAYYNFSVGTCQLLYTSVAFSAWRFYSSNDPYTRTDATYTINYAQPGDVGTVPSPGQFSLGVTAVVILAEGVASICAVVLPRNFAYYSGGVLVADNSQESAAPQVILIDGSGALGPETLITCAAANANLITFPINNTFAAGMAAGSPNVGAGDDSKGAGD